MKNLKNVLLLNLGGNLFYSVQHDSLYDESGVMCYEYGDIGEVTKETRIYALPFLTNALALSTQFTYDSWGRILNITYPDNEVVNYAYDLGGQLQSITNNSSYTYLDNVTYDRFGAKVSQTYGNGITTDYTYDNTTRRLSAISTTNNGSPMSNIGYLYDLVGNVTQVTSTCPWLNSQSFMESFTYDASDQLTAATEMQNQSYSLSVTYGNWGKITSYSLAQIDLQHNVTTQVSRSMTYPSNINNIGNSQTMFAPTMENGYEGVDYTFGINGSLRKREVQHPMPYTEYYLFNSAANLKAYSNNGLDFAYYGYNASNTRTYKLSFLNTNQWVNGQPEPFSLQLQSAMFYPNAYVNFNHNGEYTKHYYNGAERIASRLGITATPVSVTANARLTSRSSQLDNRFQEDILDLMTEGVSVSSSGGVNVSSLESPTGTASDIYYYHTNHLGSTAFVTDQNQNVTQGFLYAPFGEITTEYNATFGNDIIPKYSFNAKELDEETGMYYYEARYYKPPVFTSRDAMFEKKPWFSPYVYCKNNPIIMIDPNGRDEYEFDKKGNHVRTIENKEADIIRVVNRKGKEIAVSDPFAYGTVQEVESDGSKPNKTTLSINNNANRISIFEFLAENTNVEWMTISAKKDNVEKNYVATSKLRDKVSNELVYKLKIEDYTATAYAHSHPKNFFGNNYPSGYGYLRDKEGYGDFDSFITLKQLWHDIDVRVFDANNGHYYLLGRTKDDVIDIDRQGNRKKLNPYQ